VEPFLVGDLLKLALALALAGAVLPAAWQGVSRLQDRSGR